MFLEKPGTEYYGLLTTVQFFICVFTVSYFANFGAQGPYEESNLFKTEMLVVLFYQITIIILDRYCARTKTLQVSSMEKNVTDNSSFLDHELFKPSGIDVYDAEKGYKDKNGNFSY